MLVIAFIGSMSLYLFPTEQADERIVAVESLRPLNTMDFSYDESYKTERSASFIIETRVRQ